MGAWVRKSNNQRTTKKVQQTSLLAGFTGACFLKTTNKRTTDNQTNYNNLTNFDNIC